MTVLTILLCVVLWLWGAMRRCSRQRRLIPEHFHLHHEKSRTIKQVLPTSPFSPPLPPTNLHSVSRFASSGHFLSAELYLLWLLYLASCPQHSVFRTHSTCQALVPFYGCIIFHSGCPMFIQSSLDGCLGCFHLLAVLNNSLNVWGQVLDGCIFVILLGINLGRGVRVMSQLFNLGGNCWGAFHSSCAISHSPQLHLRVPVSLHFLHILAHPSFPFCFLFIFNLQPHQYVWRGVFSFGFLFLGMVGISLVLFGHLFIIFGEMSVPILHPICFFPL